MWEIFPARKGKAAVWTGKVLPESRSLRLQTPTEKRSTMVATQKKYEFESYEYA